MSSSSTVSVILRWWVPILIMVWATWVNAQEGPARVIDGDTLEIVGERVRLHGIDAPEREQTCTIDDREWECGIAAWGRMIELLAGQVVRCERRDVDRYGRTVAVCRINGDDAFKMKRAVKYSYLDYSTLESRRKFCEAEIGLNRRTVPELYEALVPVTLAGGALALGGNGEPVEWLVKRPYRFPAGRPVAGWRLSADC